MNEKVQLLKIAEELSRLVQVLSEKIEYSQQEPKQVYMLTIAEAAELINGISKYQINLMVKKGLIPCVRAGGKTFINRELLYRYFNNQDMDID